MDDTHGHDPESLPLSSDAERDRALAEVVRHTHERSEARRSATAQMRRQHDQRGVGPRHGVFALVLVATLYVWLAAPGWASFDRPEPPSRLHREASLRIALYLQAQRIEEFRMRNGELPDSLAQTGPPLPGVRYEKTDLGTYHLEGQNDTLALFYSSSARTSLREFLRGADALVFPPERGGA